MPIKTRDAETDRLAREVAALTNETITVAVSTALKERLDRERPRRRDGVTRLLAIGERCAARMGPEANSADHGRLFYDDAGPPR